MMSRSATRVIRSFAVYAQGSPRYFSTATAGNVATKSASTRILNGSGGIFHLVNPGKVSERAAVTWIRLPVMGARNASTVVLDAKEQKEEKVESGSAGGVAAGGGGSDDKVIVSYWGISSGKVTKEDGSEWRWRCFRIYDMANPKVPIGYKFSPSPEQSLVYLKGKILNQELPSDVIRTVDIYSCGDPHQIPFSEFTHGVDNEWFFFTNKQKETRIQTTNGSWEEIGDQEISDSDDETIGFMRILEFSYSNPEDAEKEKEWYIHEYSVNPANFTADELADDNVKEKISNFVLCKVVCEEEFPPCKPPTSSSSDDVADDEGEDNEVVDGANS